MTTTMVADQGIFIPRELLPVGGEWTLMIEGYQIVLRPKMDRATAHKNMRELRERLKVKYGVLPASTLLIREDRERCLH